ncbi:AraC family transcriptional regulator [Algoriphagus sp. Y33]|uniref:helix-turn-helix domain-containing protein n=1 Tax=Algoriphagus sp. Y33 TaxID=2772483 RepID=UPI001CE19673|nr:helix-turn-helix transcriptional regulator [Algoriphagus sp. Y33]
MNSTTSTIHLKSMADMHKVVGISKPKHPLFSILRFEHFPQPELTQRTKLISDFYQIALKKECPCKMQYGQTPFDFDEGIISCFAPKQVSIVDKDFAFAKAGWIISIHPDFLRTYPLSSKMKSFGFFDYDVNEALILSEDEQQSIEIIIEQIEKEYLLPIDRFSQDVIISALDLLFTHFSRYYNRQFVIRQPQGSELLNKVENILNASFSDAGEQKLPTPAYLASQLSLSPKYLSDCLKQLTGQTTQQIIHEKLIEKAKDILTTTEISVSEIAYQLGFEYPQSFSKLFKNKMNVSPLEFRASFN